MKRFFYLFLLIICCNFVQGQYVTMSGRQFKDENGNNFYPLVCNYVINTLNLYDATSFTSSWVSPYRNYHRANYYCYNQTDCNNLIETDLEQMVNLGFNAVRIMSLNPIYYHQGYVADPNWTCPASGLYVASSRINPNCLYACNYPNSYDNIANPAIQQKLFESIVNMLVNVSKINLSNGTKMKVILITVGYPPFNMDYDPAFPAVYADYLDKLSKYISDPLSYSIYNPGTYQAVQQSILGYDLQNEPFNDAGIFPWNTNPGHSKQDICNDFDLYYQKIKTNEPHRLITLGGAPLDVFNFDPNILHLDFYSPHCYAFTFPYDIGNLTNNLTDRINIEMYWLQKNLTMPWMVGETGYQANDQVTGSPNIWGTEADQANYATNTLNNTYCNNGSGYSWWCYQDNDGGYYGTLRYSISYTADPIPDPPLTKPVASVFQNFSTPQNQSNCTQPPHYYDPYNHEYYADHSLNPWEPAPQVLNGTVSDWNGNPFPDAYIEAWEVLYYDTDKNYYVPTTTYTFAKQDLSFKVIPYDYDPRWPNFNVVGQIFVSAPGCSHGSAGSCYYSSTGITNATVILDAPSGLPYDATYHVNVSMNQNKVYEAWKDVTVDGGNVDSWDIDCKVRARNDVNIEPEFHSDALSNTWIYTTYTQFVSCNDFSGYMLNKENSITSVPQKPISDVKQIHLNFMADTNQVTINIYPNPSSGIFTFESSNQNNLETYSIEIFDLFSKTIYTTTSNCKRKKIDLSAFDAGMYYVRISNLNFQTIKKIIIIK